MHRIIVSTSHIPYHKRMWALSVLPLRSLNNFRKVRAASTIRQTRWFSTFRNMRICTMNPCLILARSVSIIFLGPNARAVSSLNVLIRNWKNLNEIHRAELKLWIKTSCHVAEFLVDEKNSLYKIFVRNWDSESDVAMNSPSHTGGGTIPRQKRFANHKTWRGRAASCPQQGQRNTRNCYETICLRKITLMFGV